MVLKSTSHCRCNGRIVEELWRPPPPVRVSRVSEPMRREWGGAGCCSIPLWAAEQQNPSSNAAHEPPRPMQVFRVKPLLILPSVITIQSIQPTFVSSAHLLCFIDNIWQNIYDQCFQCQVLQMLKNDSLGTNRADFGLKSKFWDFVPPILMSWRGLEIWQEKKEIARLMPELRTSPLRFAQQMRGTNLLIRKEEPHLDRSHLCFFSIL